MRTRLLLGGLSLLVYAPLTSEAVYAQASDACEGGTCTVTFEPGFFARYAPVTAGDMVSNLPGFVLDNGDQSRGFGGAAGNVLINGERVSSKSETPSDILARIPAADVVRINLIRGQTGGLDLRGQTVVADVILKPNAASGTWAVGLRTERPDDRVLPFGELTYARAQGPLRIVVGLDGSKYQRLNTNEETVIDAAAAVLERRDEIFSETGERYGVSFNGVLKREKIKMSLNAAFEHFDEAGGETSIRSPVAAPDFRLFQGDVDERDSLEIGADVERSFGPDWDAKLIGLYRRTDAFEGGSLVNGPVDEAGVTETETDQETLETEKIARVELDYRGVKGHVLEATLEGAINRLESAFVLRQNVNGVLTPQDVPGADTAVEERRIDFSVSDSFRLGPISIDAILGGEASEILQEGGFSETRRFFFWTPNLTLTYAPSSTLQLRARALREIGQLDFFDFVSAADLGDVELSLGNPDLAPESTVTFDMTVEKRFGSIGAVSLTGFHDRISDVEDLLPLEGVLEIPGNIGSGRRTGLRGEVTVPLDQLWLKNARIDANGSWQTSSVSDPLTGADRALSNERGWRVAATIRQDLRRAKLAWSVTAFACDDFPAFGIDEIDVRGRRADIDAFIEGRWIEGVRIRLGVDDVFRGSEDRDRQVFDGSRDVAPLAFREVRDSRRSRRFFLEVSGTF